jgi:multidrug efflux pump subunit AcrA (membrane-fusion protein)
MKTKLILFGLLVLAVGGGVWMAKHPSPASTADASGRKVLYYTCSMHPWVREHKPGPCPVCGMNLTPVYENGGGAAAETNSPGSHPGLVTLEPESISTINVQTDVVERRPVRRTIHLAGEISWNSATAAWFEFTAYERDLQWLKIGQTLEIVVTSVPDKIYTAQIKAHGQKPFADADFDMMSGSTKVRAEISNPPIQPGDLGRYKWFNNLHAEAHTVAETEAVLTVPRSAVISRGAGPMVYVDKGGGHYEPRPVKLGRVGDELAEVLGGLEADEKVVTTGNLLIDSEAQLTAGQ